MLHRFAVLVAAATFVLILAGGMVTSTGSGLAVPDWPTTYGYSMFGFPFSKMVGGIFYEHGHRLIASTVGCLMIVLAFWLWRQDPRRWVRRLGGLALLAVVTQGMLGGLTVLFFLPDAISIGHAALAQIFFCLTVTLALVTSQGWTRGSDEAQGTSDKQSRLRRLAATTTALIYAQILVGAVVRHTGAGLAIPDFPLVFGGLLPPEWTAAIAIHFVHRVGALVVGAAILATIVHVRRTSASPELRRPAALLSVLVVVQIGLGGWTVLSERLAIVNTLHVGTGALLLATSLVLTLRAFKPLIGHPVVRRAVPEAATMLPSHSSRVRA
jgi:cytochrome c oxidase assembly protein subunit 15